MATFEDCRRRWNRARFAGDRDAMAAAAADYQAAERAAQAARAGAVDPVQQTRALGVTVSLSRNDSGEVTVTVTPDAQTNVVVVLNTQVVADTRDA